MDETIHIGGYVKLRTGDPKWMIVESISKSGRRVRCSWDHGESVDTFPIAALIPVDNAQPENLNEAWRESLNDDDDDDEFSEIDEGMAGAY